MEKTTINLEIISNLSEATSDIQNLNSDLKQTETNIKDISVASEQTNENLKEVGQSGKKAMSDTAKGAEQVKQTMQASASATELGVQAFVELSQAVQVSAMESHDLSGGLQEVNNQMNNASEKTLTLRQQLKQATMEVQEMSEKFGATSDQAVKAAKKAALLKDAIGDAKALTDAYNPDAKFKAVGQAMMGVTGAFQAYEGALAMVGVESKELQATMVKLQSLMALTQGIDALFEAGDAFKNLGKQAVNVFKAIRVGIGSTGIGLLVVAIGTIAAYWDDIMAAVSGVTEEQKKLNEATKKNAEVQQKKLETIGNQENILKLQGKSEKQILQIKLKQTDEAIKALEISIQQQENTLKSQVEASKRNKEILKGFIMFLTMPIQLILRTIDEITGLLADLGVIDVGSNLQDDLNDWAAELVFDPEEVQKEGQAAIDEQKETLLKMKNDRAGLQLQLNDVDKQAAQSRTETAKQEAQQALDIQRRLWDLRAEMTKEGYQKEMDAIKEKYKREREDVMNDEKLNAKQKKALKEQLLLNEQYALAELEKQEAERKETIRRKIFDLEVETIKDQAERELAINKEKYERLRQDTLKDEELTAEAKKKLVEYYTEQEAIEVAKIEAARRARTLSDDQKLLQAKMLVLEDELREITKNAEAQKAKFQEIQNEKLKQFEVERDIALANTELTEAQKFLILEEYANKVRDLNKETADYMTKTDEESAKKKGEIFEAVLDQIKAGFSLLNEISALSAEIQTKQINKKYDAEKKKAEGNVELQNELEQRRVEALNKANKRAFNMKKASDLASATIDGYRAVLSTYAQTPGGPVLKGIAAGIAGAFSAVNIAKIASQKFEGATFEPQEAGGNGAEAGAGGTISPEFNVVGDSGINQLQQANQPLQAYVVSGNVTTAQSLDRERIETATL